MALRRVLLAVSCVSMFLLMCVSSTGAAGRGPVGAPASPDVAKAQNQLKALGKFKNFLRIMSDSGLEAYLKTYINVLPCTVFAFTDDAYNALTPAKRQRVNNPAIQLKLVSLHIVNQFLPGSLLAALPSFASLTTLEGAKLVKFTSASGRPAIGVAGSRDASQTAVVVQTNVWTSNALVIHACNNILLPP